MRDNRTTAWARGSLTIAALTVLLIVTGLLTVTARWSSHDSANPQALCTDLPVIMGATSLPSTVGNAAATVLPSVVSITATSNAEVDSGAGIVIGHDGLIVTNNHLVAAVAVNGGTIEVAGRDGPRGNATIVGRRPADDIAVLQAPAVRALPVAVTASSTTLHVGDPVIAVGDPLGQIGTVTAGIVSALRRSACVKSKQTPGDDLFGSVPALPRETDLDGLIQTDAPINPGNSGGALADLRGRVVGICTLALTVDGASTSNGIGFAIPIEDALRDAASILAAQPQTPDR